MPVILFLSANGDPDVRLAVGREAREAWSAMRLVDGTAFDFRVEADVGPDEIVELVQQYRPTVLHFSGHGDPDGSLSLSEEALVAPLVLRAIVDGCPGIQALVLNACYSEVAAAALEGQVPVVVGMKYEIEDRSARVFSRQFYSNLARGDSMRAAFSAAASAVAAANPVDAGAPQLLESPAGAADRLILRRAPAEIRAVFEHTRNGRPKLHERFYYGMDLYIHGAPDDASTVVYQLHPEYEEATEEGAFRAVDRLSPGFRTRIQTEGDFLVRATIWQGRRGIAIDAFVVEALRRHYDALDPTAWDSLDQKAILRAMQEIEAE